jgi:hypothetical protein
MPSPGRPIRRAFRHLEIALGFVALAVILTWPLAIHLGTHVPGQTADDNVTFLWGFWWMRHALATGLASVFHTTFVFYPVGTDLVLNTNTTLNAFIGATMLGGTSIVTALNLTTIAACSLNGFAAYLLAFRVTACPERGRRACPERSRRASVAAGVYFAASPCLSGYVAGHFNLYSAWGLPLFAYFWISALDDRSWLRAVFAGVVLAAILYTDYYYVVYAGAFALLVLVARLFQVTIQRAEAPHARTLVDHALLGITILAIVIVIVVAVSGGGVIEIGSLRLSLTTGHNVRTLAWITGLVWLWRSRRPWVSVSAGPKRAGLQRPGQFTIAALTGATFLLLSLPVLLPSVRMITSGNYVTQAYQWRSAPAGLDLASMVAGNPNATLGGGLVRRLYTATGLDPLGETAWLGLVAIVIIIATRRAWIRSPGSGFWLVICGVFLLWALGPFLMVFGINTGLLLPQILQRYVPIAANARVPSHAIVMASLAVAVLLALAIASSRIGRARGLWTGAIALMLIELCPAPIPTVALDRPALYTQLAAMPDGAVLEIPLGLRDGFGAEGRVDPTVLYYQSIHGKPIMGGYISRMSPEISARYHASPVLDMLLRLCAAQKVPPPSPAESLDAATYFKSIGVRYVVVNREMATIETRAYIRAMPVRLVTTDGPRELYVIE